MSEFKVVKCAKYGKEMPALDKAPFPGEEGKRILENISADAWHEWLNFQTILINENRLNLMNADARKFLAEKREVFLFQPGELAMPSSYTPPVPKFD